MCMCMRKVVILALVVFTCALVLYSQVPARAQIDLGGFFRARQWKEFSITEQRAYSAGVVDGLVLAEWRTRTPGLFVQCFAQGGRLYGASLEQVRTLVSGYVEEAGISAPSSSGEPLALFVSGAINRVCKSQ